MVRRMSVLLERLALEVEERSRATGGRHRRKRVRAQTPYMDLRESELEPLNLIASRVARRHSN
jgi:hypothetical protein